jgi:hypothetical protein
MASVFFIHELCSRVMSVACQAVTSFTQMSLQGVDDALNVLPMMSALSDRRALSDSIKFRDRLASLVIFDPCLSESNPATRALPKRSLIEIK